MGEGDPAVAATDAAAQAVVPTAPAAPAAPAAPTDGGSSTTTW